MNFLKTFCMIGLLALANTATAAVFCVTTTAELNNAIATASDNGQTDTIKIHIGTYLLTESLDYLDQSNSDLFISGGWFSIPTACAVQTADARLTVLDGQGTRGGILLQPSATAPGTYSISNLTITRTRSDFNNSPGILGNFNSVSTPVILELFNLIIRNNVDNSGNKTGIRSVGPTHLRVRNVLIADNQSPGFIGISVQTSGAETGSVYAHHVTIANNVSTGNSYAGVEVLGNALLTLENSILWGNTSANPQGNCPLDVTNADRLRFVIASSICGQQSGSNIGVNSFNPLFRDADFRIGTNSPAYNVGLNPPTLPLILKDINGNDRVLGVKPDLGAYESTELFRTGFE